MKEITITVAESGSENPDAAVQGLLEALNAGGFSCKRAAAELPPGGKDLGIDANTLLIAILSSGGILTTLSTILGSFLARNEQRSIKIQIGDDSLEVKGVNQKERQRLMELWISQVLSSEEEE